MSLKREAMSKKYIISEEELLNLSKRSLLFTEHSYDIDFLNSIKEANLQEFKEPATCNLKLYDRVMYQRKDMDTAIQVKIMELCEGEEFCYVIRTSADHRHMTNAWENEQEKFLVGKHNLSKF